MKPVRLFISIFVLAASLLAADVTGIWSGEVKLPTGQSLPFVARLRQTGDKVTGKLDGINGAPDVEIVNGKVEGGTVTFSGVREINGAPVKFNYSGHVMDDMIHFTILRDDGQGAPLSSMTKRTE